MLRDLLCDLGCLGSHRLSWAQASLSGAQPFTHWLQRLVKLKSQNLEFLQLPLPWRQKGAVQLQHGHWEMMDSWWTEADFWWLHFVWVMFLMTLTFISVYWLSFLFKKHELKYSFLKGHLCTVENYLVPALSSKSAHLSPSLWSWVSIFSLSTGSAVAAILSPSAWIISTVGRRSSNSLWSSCRWREINDNWCKNTFKIFDWLILMRF